jgi:hypothetical protein
MIRVREALVLSLLWLPLAAQASGCGKKAPEGSPPAPLASPGGDAAVWFLGPDQKLRDSSTRFVAVVSRLGCNGGVTGEVLAPEIRRGESEIVVTFAVDPRQPGPAPCQGNDPVPYEVDLGEPLGHRSLVDGECLARGEAVSTSFCSSGARRHPE